MDRFGFRQRYNSVKRFCRALRTREPEQFDRLEFLPGEECQVDYGEGALTRHPHSGRYRRPRLFIMTLRYSRRSYRQVVWKSSSEVWARLHEQAFRYFGGAVNYCVLDNLKEGVITPDGIVNLLPGAARCCNRCMKTPNVDLPSYRGYRFPATVISHCVWLYFRFSPSYRDVEEMMAERGVVVNYETIREWC